MTGCHNLLSLALVVILAACADTNQARDVKTSGFLSDYSKLRKGEDNEPLLIYQNPNAKLTDYNTVLVDPVTVLRHANSGGDEVPEKDLKRLATLLEAKIIQAFKKEDYAIARKSGFRIMRVRAAITEAEQASDTMNAMTAVVPLPSVSKLTTGTRAFAGKASIEAEVTDSLTGEVVAAMVDRRAGGRKLQGKTNSWNDVEQAFEFWANRLAYRLCLERGKYACVEP